jgi:hypothetical protein
MTGTIILALRLILRFLVELIGMEYVLSCAIAPQICRGTRTQSLRLRVPEGGLES